MNRREFLGFAAAGIAGGAFAGPAVPRDASGRQSVDVTLDFGAGC